MGFPNGDIKLSANFELNVGKPLDSRNVVTNFSDLTSISFKYAGMIVYVTSENRLYTLDANLTTWAEITTDSINSATTAGNGITFINNVIELGGAFTKNTDFNLNSKRLKFYNVINSPINGTSSFILDFTSSPKFELLSSNSVDNKRAGIRTNSQSVYVGNFNSDNTLFNGFEISNGLSGGYLKRNNINVLDFSTGIITDPSNKSSLSWFNRTLHSTSGSVIADFKTGAIRGYWTPNNNADLITKKYLDTFLTSGYIPLTGTIGDEYPVTGDIEFIPGVGLYNFQNGRLNHFKLNDTVGSATLVATNNSSGHVSTLTVRHDKVKFSSRESAILPALTLEINQDDIIFSNEDPSWKGVTYNQDYSANYTSRSLVDKEYVDKLASTSGVYTAGDGIDITSNVISLNVSNYTTPLPIYLETNDVDSTNILRNATTEGFEASQTTISTGSYAYIKASQTNGFETKITDSDNTDYASIKTDISNGFDATVTTNNGSDITYFKASPNVITNHIVNGTMTTDLILNPGGFFFDLTDGSGNSNSFDLNPGGLSFNLVNGSTTVTMDVNPGGLSVNLDNPTANQTLTINPGNFFVNIDDNSGNTANLQIQPSYNSFVNEYGNLTISSGGGIYLSYTPNSGFLQINSTEFNLFSGNDFYITSSDATGTTINTESGGLKYTSDFSPTYTNRSLVDKAYVDYAIANSTSGGGSSYVAGDGIDITSNVISLNLSNYTSTNDIHFYSDTNVEIGDNFNGTYIGVYNYSGGMIDIYSPESIYINANDIYFQSGNIHFSQKVEYDTDLSPTYTNRTLVDKEYVDNLISTSGGVDLSNYLGTVISLTSSSGSTTLTSINGDTTINADNANISFNTINGNIQFNTDTFYVATNAGGSVDFSVGNDGMFNISTVGTGYVNIVGADNTNIEGGNSYVYIDDYGIYMYAANEFGAGKFEIYLDSVNENALIVDNSSSPKGLQYANNYSSTFTNRSLVDKEYVDNLVSSSTSGGASLINIDDVNMRLLGSGGITAVHWSDNDRALFDVNGNPSLWFNYRILTASDGADMIDWENKVINSTFGTPAINWGGRILMDDNINYSIDWNNRYASDNIGNMSIDWQERILYSSQQLPIVNWKYDAVEIFADDVNGSNALLRIKNVGKNKYINLEQIVVEGWNQITDYNYTNLNSIHFKNSSSGYIAGYNNFSYTHDGGETWTLDTLTGTTFVYGAHFNDDNNGYVITTNALYRLRLFKTTDGGSSWTFTDVSGLDFTIPSNVLPYHVFNNSVIYVFGVVQSGGSGGKMIKTVDGGSNWSVVTNNLSSNYYAIMTTKFINQNTGFIAGFSNTFVGRVGKTTDGGSTWVYTDFTGVNQLWDIHFKDANNGFVVGTDNNGIIIRTTDGGATWQTPIQLPNTTVIRSIIFTDSNNGYAVGKDTSGFGVIFKSTDGGSTWNLIKTITGVDNFRHVTNVGGDKIYAVGQNDMSNGLIVYTTTAGEEFNKLHISNNSDRGMLTNLATPTSLYDAVNKEYVDNIVSGFSSGTTSGSGLTTVGNRINLGGTLTANTTIDSDNTYDFTITNSPNIILRGDYVELSDSSQLNGIWTDATSVGLWSYSSEFTLDTNTYDLINNDAPQMKIQSNAGDILIESNGDNIDVYAQSGNISINAGFTTGKQLYADGYLINLVGYNQIRLGTISGNQKLEFNSGSAAYFTDLAGYGGIRYAGDYSGSFVARSLVDKEYVDGLISNIDLSNYYNETISLTSTSGNTKVASLSGDLNLTAPIVNITTDNGGYTEGFVYLDNSQVQIGYGNTLDNYMFITNGGISGVFDTVSINSNGSFILEGNSFTVNSDSNVIVDAGTNFTLDTGDKYRFDNNGITFAKAGQSFGNGNDANIMLNGVNARTLIGTGNAVTADYGTVIGCYSVANYIATAIGAVVTATNNYSTAIGNYANATQVRATAIGSNVNASGLASTVVGNTAQANHSGTIAIGYGVRANADRSVVIGSAPNSAVGIYNNLAYSIMMGVNSDTSSLTILGGNGSNGSLGNIGINHNNPTARLDIAPSSTNVASLRLRTGVAPSAPNEGDIWFDGTNLKMYIGGVIRTFTMT